MSKQQAHAPSETDLKALSDADFFRLMESRFAQAGCPTDPGEVDRVWLKLEPRRQRGERERTSCAGGTGEP